MPTHVVLRPEDQPEVAAFIYALMRPHQEALPALLDEAVRWKILVDAASIAWTISRLERRPEGAGLARRSYADIASSAPSLMWLVDDMLGRARKIAKDDWYPTAYATVELTGDTLIITAIWGNGGLPDLGLAGLTEH